MKIKDIIKTVSTYISREDVVNYLNDETSEVSKSTLETVDLLTRLANLVITELAEGMIVMKKTEKTDGFSSVKYSELTFQPLDVISVGDINGKPLSFTKSAYGVSSSSGGIYSVMYSYLPPNYDLNENIGEFEKNVSQSMLSYGVIAEYLLTQGRFDEAVMWNKRYNECIDNLCLPKNSNIKARSFI